MAKHVVRQKCVKTTLDLHAELRAAAVARAGEGVNITDLIHYLLYDYTKSRYRHQGTGANILAKILRTRARLLLGMPKHLTAAAIEEEKRPK